MPPNFPPDHGHYPNKYDYAQRARNLLWALLCQGILNDPEAQYDGDGLITQVRPSDSPLLRLCEALAQGYERAGKPRSHHP